MNSTTFARQKGRKLPTACMSHGRRLLIEKAEYEAAKNEQAFVEGRIKGMEILLATPALWTTPPPLMAQQGRRNRQIIKKTARKKSIPSSGRQKPTLFLAASPTNPRSDAHSSTTKPVKPLRSKPLAVILRLKLSRWNNSGQPQKPRPPSLDRDPWIIPGGFFLNI